MYVGRIVAIGRTVDGRMVAAYRVSSRSFPNRTAKIFGQSVQIAPIAGSPDETSDSPYIAYECLVWNSRFAVVSNGTHTRPIFERLKAGNAPRDAIAGVLIGLDREFDEHDTPRIRGLFDAERDTLWLGSITADSLSIMPLELEPGRLAYITTYGFPLPSAAQCDRAFKAESADAICEHITQHSIFADFEKPVCSAAAVLSANGIEIGTMRS